MANLTIDASTVRIIQAPAEAIWNGPIGETGTGGEYYRPNTSTGKMENGNATTTTELGNIAGILIDSVATANLAGTVLLLGTKSLVSLGDALDALAYGAPVYIGDTDATLSDTAGTVSRVVGYVYPLWNGATADKVLYLA